MKNAKPLDGTSAPAIQEAYRAAALELAELWEAVRARGLEPRALDRAREEDLDAAIERAVAEEDLDEALAGIDAWRAAWVEALMPENVRRLDGPALFERATDERLPRAARFLAARRGPPARAGRRRRPR